MGIIDQMDKATDRYNDSLSRIDSRPGNPAERWAAYEYLHGQIKQDIQKLENAYLEVMTNPSLNLVEALNIASERLIEVQRTHIESIAHQRQQFESQIKELRRELKSSQEQFRVIENDLRQQVKDCGQLIEQKETDAEQLRSTIQDLQRDQFIKSVGSVVPLKK